MREERTVNYS